MQDHGKDIGVDATTYTILLDGCTSVPVFQGIVGDAVKAGLTEPALCGAMARGYMEIVGNSKADKDGKRDGEFARYVVPG